MARETTLIASGERGMIFFLICITLVVGILMCASSVGESFLYPFSISLQIGVGRGFSASLNLRVILILRKWQPSFSIFGIDENDVVRLYFIVLFLIPLDLSNIQPTPFSTFKILIVNSYCEKVFYISNTFCHFL